MCTTRIHSLDEALQAGPPTLVQVLELGCALAAALESLRTAEQVLLDLSPARVLWTDESAVARLAEPAAALALAELEHGVLAGCDPARQPRRFPKPLTAWTWRWACDA